MLIHCFKSRAKHKNQGRPQPNRSTKTTRIYSRSTAVTMHLCFSLPPTSSLDSPSLLLFLPSVLNFTSFFPHLYPFPPPSPLSSWSSMCSLLPQKRSVSLQGHQSGMKLNFDPEPLMYSNHKPRRHTRVMDMCGLTRGLFHCGHF